MKLYILDQKSIRLWSLKHWNAKRIIGGFFDWDLWSLNAHENWKFIMKNLYHIGESHKKQNWAHTQSKRVWLNLGMKRHAKNSRYIKIYKLCISHVTKKKRERKRGYKSSSVQSSRLKIDAAPRLIQWFGFLSVFNWMNMTKFDECPVVASTPRLSVVL